MPSNDTTTKFKADISQLKSQMQAASRAVKVATSEFKAATAGLDDWSKSADGLQAKLKQLDTTLSSQNKQLSLMEDELEKTVKVYGENSAAADNVRIKINNQKAAIAQTQKQIQRYNQDLEDCQNGVGKFATEQDKAVTASDKLRKAISNQESELNDLKKAYQDAKLDGNTEAAKEYASAIQKLSSELRDNKTRLSDAENAADEFDASLDDVKDSSSGTSEGFTVMKGALANLVSDGIRLAVDALKDLAKETYTVGANFESAMSQVEAVSGATSEEVDALTAKAKEMGESSVFSATQSAEAFNYMAMAGWETEDMLNGIEGIMNLAAASGEDLATTSDIVTDALTAMGYSAGDAGQLADVMAAASSNANTNVALMGATFQYAAPIVGALGYNMEDTAVAIGLMANAGIKGEKAGTALRSILTRLSAPPKECADAMEELGISLTDSEGNMKDLDDVMGDLRSAFSGLSETQKTQYAKSIAGQEAMSGLLAVTSATTTDFDKLTKAVENSSGAASEMADTMNDNVNGQLTLLKSQIESIMINIFEKASGSMIDSIHSIGDALDSVDWDKVGNAVGTFAQKVAELFAYVVQNGSTIINILKVIGVTMTAVFVANKIATFVNSLKTLHAAFLALKTSTDAATASTTALSIAQMAIPWVAVAAGIAAVTAAVVIYNKKQVEAAGEAYKLTEAQNDLIDKINEEHDAYTQLNETRLSSSDSINSEYGYLEQLKEEYNNLIDKNGEVKEGYEDRANFIVTTLAESLGLEQSEIEKLIGKNGELKDSIDEVIQKKQAEALLTANEELYTKALQGRSEALANMTSAQSEMEAAQQTAKQTQDELNAAMEEMEIAMQHGLNPQGYAQKIAKLSEANDQAQNSYDELKKAFKNAETDYTSYNSTIQNYEGLSSAVISGDQKKISSALTKMQYDFQTAETGTKSTLEKQLQNYKDNLSALEQAIKDGTPGVTQEQVDQAKSMVDAAQNELDKLEGKAKNAGQKAGTANAKGIESRLPMTEEAANQVKDAIAKKLDGAQTSAKSSGSKATSNFSVGVTSMQDLAKAAGEKVADKANTGLQSKDDDAEQSGKYFGQGFINGIGSLFNDVWEKAKKLAQKAWDGLRKGQQEGSPSKLTFKSGEFFTKGFINGIVSLQGDLQKTVQNMVASVIKEMATMSNYNFSEVGESASSLFSTAISSKIDYMLARIQYETDEKLTQISNTISQYESELDSRVSSLESARDKDVSNLESARDKELAALNKKLSKAKTAQEKADIKAEIKAVKAKYKSLIAETKKGYNKQISQVKSTYNKLISEQEKIQEAFSNASSEMISGFQDALNDYSTQAQTLINDTINGITDTYNARYDALISKQDTLIEKLQSAGDLFNISSANVMTINDIQAQTAAIKQYAEKLKQIKERVSSDLFDQIASYDMEQGEAFIDRLLAMSDAELQAYSDAYDEKLSVSEQLAQDLYQSDFDEVADDYADAIQEAFADLPDQLEELGYQVMEGFLNGMTSNTDYMKTTVKNMIADMVSVFKDELGIHSPSRVAMELGAYTGEGFADGLEDMINTIKKTAKEISDVVTSELDFSDSINVAKAATSSVSALSSGGVVSSSGTTTNQEINFYQTNTSPKALDRLTIYRQTNNMLFSAKVRLADV